MRTRILFLLRFYAALLLTFILAKLAFLLLDAPAGTAVGAADCLAVVWHGLPLDLAAAGYLTALPWLATAVSVWTRVPRLRLGYQVYAGIVAALLAVIFVADTCLYTFWDVKLDGTVVAYIAPPQGGAAAAGLPRCGAGAWRPLPLFCPAAHPLPPPVREAKPEREHSWYGRGRCYCLSKGANAPFDPPGESALKSLRADPLIYSTPHR